MDAASVAARAEAMGFRRDLAVEFGRAPIGEKIAEAAIHVNGRIFKGRTHTDAIDEAARDLGMPFEQMTLGPIPDGFMTNAGRYVSRWEAGEIANRAGQGQIRPSFFGATRGLQAEDTTMSGVSPSSRGQMGATAPGLAGGEGLWGRVVAPTEVARGARALSLQRQTPRPPVPHTADPGIAVTHEVAGQGVPTGYRSQRPAQMNVRELSDHEIQASLQNAWNQGHDSVLMRNYSTPTGKIEDVLVVRDAPQLRDPRARFDPARINSRNVMATGAGLGLFAPLTFPLARTNQQSGPPAQ